MPDFPQKTAKIHRKEAFKCGGKHKPNLATEATRVTEPDDSSNCKQIPKAKTNEGSRNDTQANMSTINTSFITLYHQVVRTCTNNLMKKTRYDPENYPLFK